MASERRTGTITLRKCVQVIGAGAWITVLKGKWRLCAYDQPLDKRGARMEQATTQVRGVFESKRPRVGGFSGVELRWTSGEGRKVRFVLIRFDFGASYAAETGTLQCCPSVVQKQYSNHHNWTVSAL
jgi:hypothetical protein